MSLTPATIALASCPFCNTYAWALDYDTEIDMWPVRCNNPKCNAQVCSPISQEDAMARWNTRTQAATSEWIPLADGIYRDAINATGIVVKGDMLRTFNDFDEGVEVRLSDYTRLSQRTPTIAAKGDERDE
jgi:hypothetical protein